MKPLEERTVFVVSPVASAASIVRCPIGSQHSHIRGIKERSAPIAFNNSSDQPRLRISHTSHKDA